jgi:general secretion pathway protein A
MYKNFFGLRENPFRVNPDPRYLYLTPQTQKALDELTYGVQHCKGLILLTGEVGTGKTTLVHYLLNWLREQNRSTAFIFNSHLTVNHLFDFILTDFDVPIDFRLNGNMLMRLNQWLMGRLRAGEKPVLIVDEAQGLSIAVLEEIRLLLNLETDSERLLQIVLVGQPELEKQLRRPELRQLRQRIELRCSTAPLDLEESHGYITERLRIAGANGKPIFPSETMDAAYFYSKGIPRVINLLCEHALINAYAEQACQVPVWAVEEAARDFLLEESRPVTAGAHGGDGTSSDSPAMQSIFKPIWGLGDSKQERTLDSKLCPPTAIVCRDENEPVAATKKNSGFGPKGSAVVDQALNTILHGFSQAWIRTLLFVVELWTRASAAAQLNKQASYLTQMLQHWFTGFKRDWSAMMNAVEFPRSAKSLFQWLRQPSTSKRMDSNRKPV